MAHGQFKDKNFNKTKKAKDSLKISNLWITNLCTLAGSVLATARVAQSFETQAGLNTWVPSGLVVTL